MALNRKPENPVKVTNMLGYNNGITVVDMVSKSPDYSFTAFLTQVSNEAPKMHVLYDDTLPEHTFVSTYESSGVYRLHSVIINPRNTKVEINNAQGSAYPCLITAKVHDGYIEINSYDSALSLMDDTLMDTPIKVEIWLNADIPVYVAPTPFYPLACYEGTYFNFGYAYYVTEVVINGNTVTIPFGTVSEGNAAGLLSYLQSVGYPNIQTVIWNVPSFFIQFKDSSYLITDMTLDDGIGNVFPIPISIAAYCLPEQICFSTNLFELPLHTNPILVEVSINGSSYPCTIPALPQYLFIPAFEAFLTSTLPPDLYGTAPIVYFVQKQPGKFQIQITGIDDPNVIDGMVFSDDNASEIFVPVINGLCPQSILTLDPTSTVALQFTDDSELIADYFDPATATLQDWNNLMNTSFTAISSAWGFYAPANEYRITFWGGPLRYDANSQNVPFGTMFQGYSTFTVIDDYPGYFGEIEPMALMNNTGFRQMTLNGLEKIGESAFENMVVNLPAVGLYNWAMTLYTNSGQAVIGKKAFKNLDNSNGSLLDIGIFPSGNSTAIIEEEAFANSDFNRISSGISIIPSVGDNAFNGCLQLTNLVLNFSNTLYLGSTAGNNGVFGGITGLSNAFFFDTSLQTNNGGLPDGDIQTLIANNPSITIAYI